MKSKSTAALITSGALAGALLAGSALPAAASTEADAKPAPPPASSADRADDAVSPADAAKFVSLVPYVEKVRPFPGPNGHDYSYSTTTNFWSAVAVEMPLGGDVDLRLYDNRKQTKLLNTSSFGAGETDFIAVDSNHRAFGSYFPKAVTFAGDGAYGVELAHGGDVLDNADETVAVSASDVVLVRDTFLVGGEQYFFAVTGLAGSVLYLMGSFADVPSSWVRSRAQAIDNTDTGGFPIFAFTPPSSDWYGVVVTLPGTAGEVTMLRSGGPGPT